MSAIFSFFWLLFFEFIPNFFGVAALAGLLYYRLRPLGLRTFAVAYTGSILSVLTIVLFENTKVRVTSIPPSLEGSITSNILFAGIFAIAIILVHLYFRAKWSSIKVDVIIGIVLAFLISGYEFISALVAGDTAVATMLRFITHTGSFIIAFPLSIMMIRQAGGAKTFNSLVAKVLIATLVMSLVIVLIDYIPFLT